MLTFTKPRPLFQLFLTGTATLIAVTLSPAERAVPPPSPMGATPPQEAANLNAEVRSAGADENWWQVVSTQIARSEYEPKTTEAGLQAPNRAQNLRMTFGERGIEVTPRTMQEVAPTWRFSWETSGIGREGSMREVEAVSPQSAGDRVAYRHDGWSEWYVNTSAGLEQGFTIERPFRGEGPLRIVGTFPEALTPDVREDGSIDFLESHGACAIRYGELHSWDADGVELHSDLVLNGAELAIVIDDRDATYPVTVDPLMTSPAWTAESNQASANFGVAVATAGDVNGDGFSDVIVGAQQFDSPTTAEGKAFLYYGSASGLSLTPNWTCEGNQLGAQLGYSVATAGDVNGDGFDDVIVGAFSYNNGETDEGRAFVFHGSASGPSAAADWSAESNQASAAFGISVATAGDVNGDGFDDVIVGAYNYDNGQIDEGRVFVYYGSAGGLNPNVNWLTEPNVGDARFGNSVATAGDVNGDGYSDVIIGAYLFTNGQVNEGKVYVYHGSPGGLNLAWVRESNQPVAYYGVCVATAGDVNGDGYSDVIVGAHGISDPEVNEGRAYAYYGSSSGLSVFADWTAESHSSGSYFGYSLATAGDVNGDGYGDIIVGAYGDIAAPGYAFVYFGSKSGLNADDWDWVGIGSQPNEGFGFSVATAGDVNGDGFSEVIVGAYLFDNGQPDEGGAFVYHGSGTGLGDYSNWSAEANQNFADLGFSVGTAGDVNGDGFSDVIVGAYRFDNGETDEGRAFVYNGSTAGLGLSPTWAAESDQAGANFGFSVGTAGDVNNDGFSDVIVGSVGYDHGETDEGRAFVYYGSSSGLGLSSIWTAENDQPGANFGNSVGTAGDVNGDGFSDVIVGAYLSDSLAGRAFVYAGAFAGLGTSPAWVAAGNHPGSLFGKSVGTAGDVNGDGYSDIIVGAMHDGSVGRASTYHGSAAGLSTSAAWTVAGTQLGSEFGYSVGTAGDVNGDGFSDVIVGAAEYGNGQSGEGRAFAYHGSVNGLSSTPNWIAESNQVEATFGYSVGTAGDVNGDGFSDVIVGAPDHTSFQVVVGLAVVYHGSAAGLAAFPAWAAAGPSDDARFGNCVGTAGDVNGDGFSDVIIGAPDHTFSEFKEGAAFVYYGSGGGSLDRNPRQARSDDTAPLSLLGRSDSPSAFRLKTLGRTAAGRADIRLQAEIKPLGVAFDGTGLVTGLESNTGAPSVWGSAVSLNEMIGGLTANTPYHWRLRTVSDSPFFPHSPWSSQVGNAPGETDFRTAAGAVAVAEPGAAATPLYLEPSAPNPFTVGTRVAYTLPERGRVRLSVFDVAGREVAVLADGVQEIGRHTQAWDGREGRGGKCSAGVYFVRLEFGGRVEASKIVLTR